MKISEIWVKKFFENNMGFHNFQNFAEQGFLRAICPQIWFWNNMGPLINLGVIFKKNFFFGISCLMGYLPNSKGLQGMNDIDEGQEVDN